MLTHELAAKLAAGSNCEVMFAVQTFYGQVVLTPVTGIQETIVFTDNGNNFPTYERLGGPPTRSVVEIIGR